jgi:hypothetical protein
MVKLSSIPHEYYLGDLPGSLQYSKELREIIETNLEEDDDNCGYVFAEHSIENLTRVTPISHKKTEWSILLMMSKQGENDEIWLKAALLNKNTGKVALLTSTNDRINIERRGNRAVKTLEGNWVVGHYRMTAPIVFWRELKNRLLWF